MGHMRFSAATMMSSPSLRKNKLMFSLQSGSPVFLRKEDVMEVFSSFGRVHFLFYEPGFTWGWVLFKSEESCCLADNRILPISTSIDQWKLHTFKDFNLVNFKESNHTHQILLEDKDLPISWERFIILKEFFKKFGEVTGIIKLNYKKNGVQRIVVSFKDSNTAQSLVGSQQNILYCSVKVKPVTAI